MGVALDEQSARMLARSSQLVVTHGAELGAAQETREGWYFAPIYKEPTAGCNGLIVNKQTGALFHLGSAFSVERDLALRRHRTSCAASPATTTTC